MHDYNCDEAIKSFVIKLIKSGFDVYAPEKKLALSDGYFFIENENGGLCYIQKDFGMISCSTLHKPCTACGTGYRIDSDASISLVKDICNGMLPDWARHVPEKYRSFAEYADKNHWQDYVRIIL